MEYTIKELVKKWGLSRSGVIKRIKTLGLTVEQREVIIKKRQVIDFVILED